MIRKLLSQLLCLCLCFALLISAAYAADRDVSFEEGLAARLKALSLFRGVSDTDFDLERAPTRLEALVMLIRTLGQEEAALNGDWKHPFADVPEWADRYVGYAYEHDLARGISDTEFGTGDADAAVYLTFILRALGYSDADNLDFSWKNPYPLAEEVGILPKRVDIMDFRRADSVTVSYAALLARLKGSSRTLAEKLIGAGVFTLQQFEQNYDESLLQLSTKQREYMYVRAAEDVDRLIPEAIVQE